MALSHEIERAARVQTKPIGDQIIDDAFLALPAMDPEVESAINREGGIGLADVAVRQHPCELDPNAGVTTCTHPHHARDAAWLRTLLDVLGLATGPTAPKPTSAPAPGPEKRGPRRTPVPSTDFTWQDNAACQGEDLVLFFGPVGERHAEMLRREELAKQICGWCPVRAQCLEWAFTQPETHGVWGGLGQDERAIARRQWLRRRASNRVDAGTAA